MAQIGLFWFNSDLRIADNAALLKASVQVDKLLCVVCVPPATNSLEASRPANLSANRLGFLRDSLIELDNNLKGQGQHLLVRYESGLQAIPQLITQYNISQIYSSGETGYFENNQWQVLAKRYAMIGFHQISGNRLFEADGLPFAPAETPESFSKFRRLVEHLPTLAVAPSPERLPPSPAPVENWLGQFPDCQSRENLLFAGGETSGFNHLQNYFGRGLASTYKQTRNGLDGMDFSTKFSPWLANGCLSPRQIMAELTSYEQNIERNDSTYWIYFELLWREYYQWYAEKHGAKLFAFAGIKKSRPTTSFYAERFKKWCTGTTPYPIVNACIKQLNQTGYMSNRGRQLVASCFVHELGLDWRYGAGYMEEQLVDYDVASNWGNWQYLAGVGADPRGHRRFDLQKQTDIYDPSGEFIQRWQGDADLAGHLIPLDSADAADWPISN
jgi:deoxyribodipyrimidine photo-lyase